MAIVIKEIVVKTTVEATPGPAKDRETTVPHEVLEQLKEEILRELEHEVRQMVKRKER